MLTHVDTLQVSISVNSFLRRNFKVLLLFRQGDYQGSSFAGEGIDGYSSAVNVDDFFAKRKAEPVPDPAIFLCFVVKNVSNTRDISDCSMPQPVSLIFI